MRFASRKSSQNYWGNAQTVSYGRTVDPWMIAGGLAGLLLLIGAYWLIIGFWVDAHSRFAKWIVQVVIERGFMPDWLDVTQWTMWAYLFLGVGFLIASYVFSELNLKASVGSGVTGVLLVAISVATWAYNINDHSAAYADGTSFVVSDTEEMPDSLALLAKEATSSSDDCDMLAYRGMKGCIAEGEYDFTWEARTSSLDGATIRIRNASSGNNKTQLLEDSLSYVYEDEGEGSWTAIRDGKSREPVYSILSYDGSQDPTTCKFEGDYEINKAFNGLWGTNLSDDIADRYPNLFYSDEDRWGYCRDNGDGAGLEPVIVIPVKEQIPFHHRTAFRSAGVLVITGSPSGDVQYEHDTEVASGDYPGPVYPASLAKEQRESMGMIAGIKNSVTRNFGYEPVEEETQDGNDSEYFLRDSNTGNTYWVTPMKQRGGDNQRIVAYSVVPADSAEMGTLNHMQIFVFNDDAPQVASISDMEASVRQRLSESYQGFFAAKGYMTEFLPLDDKTWQVYAEINGRVVYRVVVPTDTNIRPTVFEIDPIEEGPSDGEEKASSCVEDLTSLSEKQLAQCQLDLAEESYSRAE